MTRTKQQIPRKEFDRKESLLQKSAMFHKRIAINLSRYLYLETKLQEASLLGRKKIARSIISWKGLRVKKKKRKICRSSSREKDRFPRFLLDRNKPRIRVIVEHVSSSVSRVRVYTRMFIPHLFESTSNPPPRNSGIQLAGECGRYWGQAERAPPLGAAIDVGVSLPWKCTFCFRHLPDPSSKIFATKNVSNDTPIRRL